MAGRPRFAARGSLCAVQQRGGARCRCGGQARPVAGVGGRMASPLDEAELRRGIGRPRSIDRDKIVATAHRLGLENLTMRAIAEQLGVTTQALYNHIGGRRELLLLLANDHSELYDLGPDGADLPWRPWLSGFAHALRRHLDDQPGLAAAVVTRSPTSPTALRFVERTVAKLAEDGFSVADALRAYRVVLEFVVGWTQRDTHPEPAGHLPPVETTTDLQAAITAAWSDSAGEDLFSLGLEALLDGLSGRKGRPLPSA